MTFKEYVEALTKTLKEDPLLAEFRVVDSEKGYEVSPPYIDRYNKQIHV